MKFVLAQIQPDCNPDWYLVMDSVALNNQNFLLDTARVGIQITINKASASDINGPTKNPNDWRSIDVAEILLNKLGNISFLNREGWYMNRVGGQSTKLHRIIKECEANDFPDRPDPYGIDDVSFSQWKNGNHWYCRLPDGTDIEHDGKTKWNSLLDAKNVAVEFLKNKY